MERINGKGAGVHPRLMKLIHGWDESNQRRAERTDRKRQRREEGGPKEVRGRNGARFELLTHRRGYPDPETYLAEALWMPALLFTLVEARHVARHRFVFHKSWLVQVTTLDNRGFPTKDSRQIVVDSRQAATKTMREISALLASGTVAALDAKIANGDYDAA